MKTDNESVAKSVVKFLDMQFCGGKQYILEQRGTIISLADFHKDYNLLHELWVKFKGIKYEEMDDAHLRKCEVIRSLITDGTITEAYNELVKGIEWYNQNKP